MTYIPPRASQSNRIYGIGYHYDINLPYLQF
ncbi:hypothetical protein BBOH_0294 [Bifidobacterium bohemicum DSM 22767]|uniref:Uncharacterized protein n=1 Tax=Bifidobacterium bohemicum DSM 22767 TaxID=1437606 RepID=A0A086ZJX0_9BIFI|nr:hypothetical protein BBOH_0294 [Bifidobacterium bohemicum DSM 22767]